MREQSHFDAPVPFRVRMTPFLKVYTGASLFFGEGIPNLPAAAQWIRVPVATPMTNPLTNKTPNGQSGLVTCARVAPNVLSPHHLSGIPSGGHGELWPQDGTKKAQRRDALQPMPNTPGFADHDRPRRHSALGT